MCKVDGRRLGVERAGNALGVAVPLPQSLQRSNSFCCNTNVRSFWNSRNEMHGCTYPCPNRAWNKYGRSPRDEKGAALTDDLASLSTKLHTRAAAACLDAMALCNAELSETVRALREMNH